MKRNTGDDYMTETEFDYRCVRICVLAVLAIVLSIIASCTYTATYHDQCFERTIDSSSGEIQYVPYSVGR